MRRILSPTDMARADRATIDSGIPARVLMDRAGRAVARAAIRVAGGRYGRHVVVICGKGNNGADGFVAARVLADEGLRVRCFVTFDPGAAEGDAAHHLRLMEAAGVAAERFDAETSTRADVYIDAVLGTGTSGAPRDEAAGAIAFLAGCAPVVAVDIPSGVDGATAAVPTEAVWAEVTVAMAAEKIGTALPPGSTHAGDVEVIDIGIVMPEDGDAFVEAPDHHDIALLLGERSDDAHKRSVGSVAVVAGSDDIRGAPLLTGRGAVRMGAGYVTLCTTEAVGRSAGRFPELLVRTAGEGTLSGDALDAIADVLDRADAIAIGPGLGSGEGQRELVERILRDFELPLVLDADALNAIADDPSALIERTASTVLTPHPGELARLLGVTNGEITADRLGAALEASRRFPHAVVVAKGHRTVIASGAGTRAVIIPTGGPELATAGTGDVLTGAVAACLARISDPVLAAVCATYIHGLAGTIAGERVGSSGVAALDVAEALPAAVEVVRSADSLAS